MVCVCVQCVCEWRIYSCSQSVCFCLRCVHGNQLTKVRGHLPGEVQGLDAMTTLDAFSFSLIHPVFLPLIAFLLPAVCTLSFVEMLLGLEKHNFENQYKPCVSKSFCRQFKVLAKKGHFYVVNVVVTSVAHTAVTLKTSSFLLLNVTNLELALSALGNLLAQVKLVTWIPI